MTTPLLEINNDVSETGILETCLRPFLIKNER